MSATATSPVVLIVLASLAAEGTPRMAVDLSRSWQARGIRPVVVVLDIERQDMRPAFSALGVEIVQVRFASSGVLRYAGLIQSLWRIARRYRARAILSMPLGWHAFVAIAGRLAGVQRVVAHVGNHPDATLGMGFIKFWAEVQLGRPFTSRLAACSDYVRHGAMKAFHLSAREVTTIPNGVRTREIERMAEAARAARPRPGDVLTIGMVATLEQHKDQPTLIRAVAKLHARGHAVRLLLVGEGRRRAEYLRLISELSAADCIELLGTRHDVPELLGSFDVFAFSTTPQEGQGIALVEAMAAGVPIVASDVPACRDVLDGEMCGRLVAAGDVDAWAAAIRDVMRDPATRGRTERARERARQSFSVEAMAEAYATLLGLDGDGADWAA